MAEQCAMIVGYLVPHRCEQRALGTCLRCGRQYCEDHLAVTSEGLICTACQQGLDQPVALPITQQSYDAADIAVFSRVSEGGDEDTDDTFADLS